MRRKMINIAFFLLALQLFANANPTGKKEPALLVCDICVNGICNQSPFNLSANQVFTFYTSAIAGATYYWTISGTGVSITGPRDQSTVQVSVGCAANGRICLVKSKDGEDAVCCCYNIVSPPCQSCCVPYPDPYYHCESGKTGSRGGILQLGGGCPEGTFTSVTVTLGYDATFLTAPYTGLQTIVVNNPTNSYPWNTYLFQFNSCINYPWPPHLPITFVYDYADPGCPDTTFTIYVEPEYLPGKTNGGQATEKHAGNSNPAVQKNESGISFSPNPANSSLRISNPQQKEFSGIIYSLDGNELIRFGNTSKEIDIARLSNGLYIIRLTGLKGEQVLLTRFVKHQ